MVTLPSDRVKGQLTQVQETRALARTGFFVLSSVFKERGHPADRDRLAPSPDSVLLEPGSFAGQDFVRSKRRSNLPMCLRNVNVVCGIFDRAWQKRPDQHRRGARHESLLASSTTKCRCFLPFCKRR
jgi:hypothetical protein